MDSASAFSIRGPTIEEATNLVFGYCNDAHGRAYPWGNVFGETQPTRDDTLARVNSTTPSELQNGHRAVSGTDPGGMVERVASHSCF